MFEKFTESAREVVVLAQEEARTLKHNYFGTEHILLGLLREKEGLAARVLESLGITVERARADIVRIVHAGEEVSTDQIPFTPRAKKVLELALREALTLGHDHIGTEHILLGLVRENDGVASRVLLDFDADAEKVRNEVIRMLPGPSSRQRVSGTASATVSGGSRKTTGQEWLDGLGTILDRLAAEIRAELGRDPDAGDLLLVLASTPQTLASQALQAFGIDLDELWGQIERSRSQAVQAQQQLSRRIEETRFAKEQAIESQDFQTAALMRDQEHELVQQTRAQAAVPPEALHVIRRHLGIPASPHTPEPPGVG
jgi:ATP-dependent Clp protease ATP-binding subunit ClpA